MRNDWYKKKHPEVSKSGDDEPDSEEPPHDIVAEVKAAKDLSEHEEPLLGSIVNTGHLASSFDDISVPERIIETLRTIITLPLLFPEAFNTGILQRESMSGVLLYGPPGTGKTLQCRIAARECRVQMLLIKPSDIINQWVGESEKLVNALFSLANRLAPCIVFIDEVDSCFRARTDSGRKWTRDMMSEFLQAMDGLVSSSKNKEGGMLVVGATNRPYDIDDAIIRRLPSRMLIGSPGEKEREAILKIHLRGEELDDDVALSDVAQMTRDYSGSDLKNLCVSAAMASVKDAVGKIDWNLMSSLPRKQPKKSDTQNVQAEKPHADDSESGVNVAKEKMKTRTVKMVHIRQAMKEVAPSSVGSHRELYRWHESFGSVSC
ncbi:P-loop containing nucleoside triphosphate hydrolase protein [Cyathus striatus]|nr:P-loop containing nucleoside triphosphate hydrolase protein [Cyathus striatus]